MSYEIVYGKNKELSDWVSLQVLGVAGLYDEKSKAIGLIKDHKLIAAVTFNHFRARPDGSLLSVEMGVCSTEKSWATRGFLRAVFSYPFIQLKMERVTTACSAENQNVIDFNKKLGFIQEGIGRKAWPLGGDSVLFSMLKHECRFI